MFGENKNLKDSSASSNLNMVVKDSSFVISYTKTNKLITALYMVTDILEKDEPLRNKLRTAGLQIISDINSAPVHALNHISDMMSFLSIASAMGVISEMNYSILNQEFSLLDKSIRAYFSKAQNLNKQINLTEFFKEELSESIDTVSDSSRDFIPQRPFYKGHDNSIGHHTSTRIGVQKGSTLLKALSDRKLFSTAKPTVVSGKNSFDLLKKQRRYEIISMIKNIGGEATITDIKDTAQKSPAQAESLVSCSEKTLQRELMSMIQDGVLDKTGEKRWSKYSIKK